MQNRKAHLLAAHTVIAVLVAMLFCAIVYRHDHEFYTALRWLCCAGFAYLAFVARLLAQVVWAVILALEAVLFNPLIKFYFGRDTWQQLDQLAIIIVVIAAAMFWKEFKRVANETR